MPGSDVGGADDATAWPPTTAADLVARLWRTAPPAVWTPGRSAATARTDVAAALAQIARDADALATHPLDAERRAAALLRETALAIGAALVRQTLADESSSTRDAFTDARTLPSALRLRLARLECWLSARAQSDRDAEPSLTVCLWTLEQLEVG